MPYPGRVLLVQSESICPRVLVSRPPGDWRASARATDPAPDRLRILMGPITITLPWAPLNNVYYRHRAVKGHAVVYLSPEGAQYKENAGMLALSQWHREPLQGPVELMV